MMFLSGQPVTSLTSATVRSRIYGRGISCLTIPATWSLPSWKAGIEGGDGVLMNLRCEVRITGFREFGLGLKPQGVYRFPFAAVSTINRDSIRARVG